MDASHENVFLEDIPAVQGGEAAPYAVLPIPLERTVSFGAGAGRGPAAVLAASDQLELFDEELREPFGLRVQTLRAVDCAQGSMDEVLAAVEEAAAPVMRAGRFLLGLGGEHTASLGLIRAARAGFGEFSVLHLDAHTDLRMEYEGEQLSHACVMRRVRELGVPVVHAGIRSLSEEEHLFLESDGAPVFWARDIVRAPDDAWIQALVARLAPRVYVSIDIDCLDPALAPGTGTPEPGGLDWYALTRLLRAVCAARELVAADLVEVAPVPGSVVTEFVAARLAAKILVYHRAAQGA